MTRSVSKQAAFILLAVMSGAPFAGPSITPIEALLLKEGPNSVLGRYFECGPQGQRYYEQVAHGSVGWLKLAAALTAEAQGCQLRLLQDSLSRALTSRPAEVLKLVDSSPELEASRICVPFLSADEPKEQHLNQLGRSERALLAVKEPQLQSARTACQTAITRARSRLE